VGKGLMSCPRCFSHVRDLAWHMKVCLVCKHCGYDALDGEDLYQHKQMVHPICVVMFTR
jgi:hypothetical protein